MVTARLTNPSFTLSHNHVACQIRARLQVATHECLYPRHTSIHNLNIPPSLRCMTGRRSPESPKKSSVISFSSSKVNLRGRIYSVFKKPSSIFAAAAFVLCPLFRRREKRINKTMRMTKRTPHADPDNIPEPCPETRSLTFRLG